MTHPLFLQLTRAKGSFGRSLPLKAHVRTLIVVEIYGIGYCSSYLFYAVENYILKQFILYDAIYPLGNRIVLGITTLSHTDLHATCLQYICVCEAGILDATVRVVYDIIHKVLVKMGKRHIQGIYRKFCLQSLTYAPSYYLLGIVVSDERKVAEFILSRLTVHAYHHIGYIAYPQLVGSKWNEVLHQVRIGGKVMVGVRGSGSAAAFAHLQAVLLHDIVETVIANGMLFAKRFLVHMPQLATANAPVTLTYALDELDDESLLCHLTHLRIIMLVIGLCAHTKQPTKRLDSIRSLVAIVKPVDYLVPAFFRSIPYTSLPNATISS